ncbi:MAG TPA: hypothetical protein VNT75_22840, partial [Symbiobacteriaceae bacterium]|nr:hypothetical protein [Symbiobacteriaceae bacterium]
MQKQSIAVILLGFVLLILSAWPAFGPQYTIMKGTTFSVPTGTTAVNLAGNPATALTLLKGDDDSLSADLSRLPAGRYTLALTPSAQEMDVQILPYSTGYTAALGALLLLLGLP